MSGDEITDGPEIAELLLKNWTGGISGF